jgi:cation diffusion facilitator CzcD-associated flavoprotein CzcO
MEEMSDFKATATPLVLFAEWLGKFNAIINNDDSIAFGGLFVSDGYWKDILSFTWEHRTFAGSDEIEKAFAVTASRTKIKNARTAEGRSAPSFVKRSGRNLIEGYFDFDTQVGKGVGFVRLIYSNNASHDLPVWLLLTTLHEIHGFEEKIGKHRPTGNDFSQIKSPKNWSQVRENEKSYQDRNPQTLIVGAGQGGVILAARLRQMGVDALVIEKGKRVGDVWRNRYNNLTLHNELIANHFPYLQFPDTWPQWLPKDMLGNWLESYADFMELNIWTSTELSSAIFDEVSKTWAITLIRGDGSTRNMACKHLVVATGVSGGTPRKAQLEGLSDFKGTILHSSQYDHGVKWAGKRAIVIGTGNSGHDVAQDLYVSGATSVSIMQRGPTCIVSLDPSARISYAIFREGRSVEDCDLMTASIPFPVLENTYKWVTKKTSAYDKDLLKKLVAVGFKTNIGEDEAGFQMIYSRGAGGYYIDVGCCELIINKKIKLIQASDTDRIVSNGLLLKDGLVVEADLLVLATGFEGMQHSVRKLLGDEIAEKLGPVWGFDQDGVMKNMWRRTSQDGLWLMGGAINEARLNSRFLALEIRAALEGLLPDRNEMPIVERRSTY